MVTFTANVGTLLTNWIVIRKCIFWITAIAVAGNYIWVFIVIYVWWYRVENHAILCKRVKINYILLLKTKYRFPLKKLFNYVYKIKKLCYKVINSVLQGVKDSDKILCTYFRKIIVQRSTTHWLWNDSSHVAA